MGSPGEGYAWYMKLLPQSYRIEAVPADLYDAMALVYEATPISVLPTE